LRNTGKSVGGRLALLGKGCLEDRRLLRNDVVLEMRRRYPSVTEHRLGDFCRAPHSILDAASEPQRWSGFAGRPHCQGELGGPEMLSLKSDVFLRVESLDQINGLCVATDPTAIVLSHDLKLVLLPAWSDTEDCASAACSIEKGHLLGDVEWIVEWQDQHARAERHAVGLGGQSHQRLEWREPCGRTVRQVVSNRDTIKPKLSRETNLFYMLRKALGHRFGGAVLGTNKQRKPHYRPHTAIERGQIACAHNFIEDSRFRFQPQLEGFASTAASIGCSGDSSASLRLRFTSPASRTARWTQVGASAQRRIGVGMAPHPDSERFRDLAGPSVLG